MPRLIAALIRHGDYHQLPDTPSAHQPFGLNEAGQQQAIRAVDTLYKTIVDNNWQLASSVDSSRLLRAWQTAQIISQNLSNLCNRSFKLREFDGLAERGLGSAGNLTVTRIEQILDQDPRFDRPPPGWKADSHYCLPLQGAESLIQAGQRVAAHLKERMAQLLPDAKQDVVKLFVGHGAAFRHAAYHLGVLSFDDIARFSMYHADPVYIEYCADGSWMHVGGDWKLRPAKSEFTD